MKEILLNSSFSWLFWLGLIFCALVNTQWLRAKFFLKKQNYSVSFFIDHWSDIRNLKKIIKETNNPEIKKRAKLFLSSILLFAMLMLISGMSFMVIFHEEKINKHLTTSSSGPNSGAKAPPLGR